MMLRSMSWGNGVSERLFACQGGSLSLGRLIYLTKPALKFLETQMVPKGDNLEGTSEAKGS